MGVHIEHRHRRVRVAAGAAIVSCLVGFVSLVRTDAATATTADDEKAATVILYGDSLAWEAEAEFTRALHAAGIGQVWNRTYGGTAICDWLDEMRTDADQIRPSVVVVEFSGNALTPCMMDEDGSSLGADRRAYHAKYAGDARVVLDAFRSGRTHVIFAGAPISRWSEATHDPGTRWLNTLYASLSTRNADVGYVDAGASVLDGGRWTATLSCLPSEPCVGGSDADGVGVNVVRAPDGTHFCPVAPDAAAGVTEPCPVWSSGAHRYGRAMADAVLAWTDRGLAR